MPRQLALSCLFAAVLAAAPLSRGERDRAMSHLHASRKMFLDAVSDLTDAQWRFKPGPGRWSIAEVAEHIALSEDALFQLVTAKILKAPPAPEKITPEQKQKDEAVIGTTLDRSRKAQAADFLQPKGTWPTRDALIEHFKQSRDRTIAFVRDTGEDLRSHFAPHPLFTELDAYQWVLLIAAHSQRHIAQIKEVAEHPDFPKHH